MGQGLPVTLLPKASITKQLMFWCRWDEPVVQPKVKFTLQVALDDSKKWRSFDTWQMPLRIGEWSNLLDAGAYNTFPEGGITWNREPTPKDLHKYTGTKQAIPPLKDRQPSYVDYPVSNKDDDTAGGAAIPATKAASKSAGAKRAPAKRTPSKGRSPGPS